MSKLDEGSVTITLNNRAFTLRPTLDAITKISGQFGGLSKARDGIAAMDFNSVVSVIQAGINATPKNARELPDLVFKNGLTAELLVPLIEFVAILGNGGRPLKDEAEQETSEGNADS